MIYALIIVAGILLGLLALWAVGFIKAFRGYKAMGMSIKQALLVAWRVTT